MTTAVAAAFLAIVPAAPPAAAQTGFAINQVNISSATVDEAAGTLTAAITITNRVGGAVTATVKTQSRTAEAGKDFAQTQTTVSWGALESNPKSITVPISDDGIPEPSEQFDIVFAGAPQGAGATAGTQGVGTITDNDSGVGSVPVITVTAAGSNSFPEGNGGENNRVYNLTLDKVYSEPVSVSWKTEDATAKAGSDYTASTGTHTWPASTNPPEPKQVVVPITTDAFGEPNETFKLFFASNRNASLSGDTNPTLTIQNDDGAAPVITIDPIPPKAEGDAGPSTMTVTLKATNTGGQPVTVDVETADGTAVASTQQAQGDYVPLVKQNVTIPTSGSKTVDIQIIGDRAQEPDETFLVKLSNANNAEIGSPAEATATIVNDDLGQITTGVGPGGGPHVKTFGSSGAELGSFFAFGANNSGGTHVARGDIFNAQGQPGADGIDEVIVGTGRIPSASLRSTPTVSVFNVSGTLLATFLAYDQNFGGGVYVAAGNIDGNVQNGDEIVTGTGAGGGPHIRAFHVQTGGPNAQVIDVSNGGFFAYDPAVTNGMRVAVGNIVGDAKDEIVTAPGPGAGSHVRVFTINASNAFSVAREFFAYPGFGGGVTVAASTGRIITGTGPGGGPHVKVFNGDGAETAGWFAYGANFTGGVFVATGNIDTSPAAEIVTGPGGGGGPHVRVFDQNGGTPYGNGFFAYQNWGGAVEVAVASFG